MIIILTSWELVNDGQDLLDGVWGSKPNAKDIPLTYIFISLNWLIYVLCWYVMLCTTLYLL